MFRLFDIVLGALGQALPDKINAAGSGQGSILLVSVPDPETGGTKVSVVQPLVGGSGGRPMKDGLDGTDVGMGFLKNVPAESIEQEVPVLIDRYALRENSGGPGYYRGGVGVELLLKVFPPNGVITSRGMERYTFRPWGRLGGKAGTTGFTTLNPGTAREREIGKIDVMHLEPGDEVFIGTQGGGGYGDPLARPAAKVLDDVRNELVDVEQARDAYGVVFVDGAVDEAATDALRAELRAQRGDALPDFDFGPERDAFERTWTPELQDAILAETQDYPMMMRHFLRARLFAQLEACFEAGERVEPSEIGPMLDAIRAAELRVGR
jgi:N-methylhydantoinase B